MLKQYQQKVENFIQSKDISKNQSKVLESIFSGRVNNYGPKSRTFKFEDGTTQRIDTYEGRAKAAAKYLNINNLDELDSLYDVVSSGSYLDTNRGESVDRAFNSIVSQNKNLEAIIGEDKYDAMTENNTILKAKKYQNLIDIGTGDENVSSSNYGSAGSSYSFGSIAVAGVMALIFFAQGLIFPLTNVFAAQNDTQKKLGKNVIYETLDDSLDKEKPAKLLDIQTQNIYNFLKDRANEYIWEVKSGEVLEKRLVEMFSYKDIKPTNAQLHYLSQAYLVENPDFKPNNLKVPSRYNNFETIFTQARGEDVVLDIARGIAFKYGDEFMSSKGIKIGNSNSKVNDDMKPLDDLFTEVIKANEQNLKSKSIFASATQMHSYIDSSSLFIPKGNNVWTAASNYLKSIGAPNDKVTLKYFERGLQELYPDLDLNKIPARTKISLKGLPEVQGIGDILFDLVR